MAVPAEERTQQYNLPLIETLCGLSSRTFEPFWGQEEYELYA